MSLHARKDRADRSAPAGRTEAAALADILLNPPEHNPTLLGATSDLCLLILSPPLQVRLQAGPSLQGLLLSDANRHCRGSAHRDGSSTTVGTILTRCPRCRRGLAANRSRAHVRASRAIACPTKESDPGKTPKKRSGFNDGCSRLDYVSKAVWGVPLSEQKLSDSKGCILSTTGADKEPNSGKLHLQGETHGFQET